MTADQLVGLMLVSRAGITSKDFVASAVGGQSLLDALVAAGLVVVNASTGRVFLTPLAETFVR